MAELTGNLRVLAEKIEYLVEEDQWADCLSACTEFLELAEEDESVTAEWTAWAHQVRGIAHDKAGSYDFALADFRIALELNPNDATIYHDRGNVYIKKDEYDHAITDFSRALVLDSSLGETYHNRGLAYEEKGDFDRAIADYTSALEIEPGNSDFRNNRANAYIEKGDYDRAISDCKEVLKKDPTNKTAIENRDFAVSEEARERSDKRHKRRLERQLKKQQEQFEADLEKRINEYDINLLRIEEYEARQKEFQNEAKEARGKMQKWLGVLRWIAGGFLALVLLCMGYTFWKGPGIWPIFPLITVAAGLCAFPFIWQIRTLKQEEARLMALSQDAYTKGILANLINVNLDPVIRKELLNKFFDHHAQHGSAQLIVDLENNGKSESGAVNVLIKYLKDNMSGKN